MSNYNTLILIIKIKKAAIYAILIPIFRMKSLFVRKIDYVLGTITRTVILI